ncbi:HD domain-containing protein [Bacillus cereus]|uniref:HD domain-containing protein n=1 Tax=Bacillus cereus TaxID=1396 RepID=UPI0013D789EA|nr:HD domain-containing protein [Bacillus cereus]MCS6595232.1 HD domain-containing protein [Bacillus cereus]
MGTNLNISKEEIIQAARDFALAELGGDSSGHDWWHVHRVTEMAKTIAKKENANIYVAELAALLHDVADEKLNQDEETGVNKVKNWMSENGIDEESAAHILEIITTMSFKGGTSKKVMSTLEGKIVQDADRLDAMGAMGISRVMCYSGFKGRPIHHPDMKPRENLTLEEYRSGKDTAIMHFYEKLLKLKDTMNTVTGKEMAEGRHAFLETYLDQFYAEWDAKR